MSPGGGHEMPVSGIWEFSITGPMGLHGGMLRLRVQGRCIRGAIRGRDADLPIQHGEIIGGEELFWTVDTRAPALITMRFSVTVVESQMLGEVELGDFGTAAFDANYLGHRPEVDWDSSTGSG